MASFFTSLKCNNCAGSLTFDRAKKVWVCDYCGSEIIREERSEGPYSIKGVAVRALTDMAEDDLDSGEKNLAECEKLDPKHAATLICRLCFNVLKFSDPDNAGNARALISQLKRDYTALNELDSSISPEEEALYEALGERPDVFAMLMLTFDTLGAKEHRDFAQHLLDPGAITSPKMNATLLNYALKRGQAEMVEKITSNLSCIDRRETFLTVLAQMPDGADKRRCVERLLGGFRLESDDRLIVNGYLEESEDCAETKLAVFCAASASGAMATLSNMASVAAGNADQQMSLAFADAVCAGKPTDDEMSTLLVHLFTEYDGSAAVSMLERFNEKGMFLAVTGNMLSRMLSRTDLSAADKCAVLTAAEQFKVDMRTNNSILADYLMNGKDDPAGRLEVVRCLLGFVGTPATATIEIYTLKCGTDGETKPEILKLLLENVSSGFLRELPKAYMASSVDDPAVKKQVLALMTGNGLALDANSLVSIACNATPATADEAAATIRQALNGGARLRSDALNEYLENTAPENLSKKLVSVLHSPGGKISDEALQKYIFYCDDDIEVKLRNALIFAEQNHSPLGCSSCAVRHQGSDIRCNLLQAYLLMHSNTPEAADMLSLMLDEGDLEARILVNGVNTKFHKYVTGQRRSLSPLAEQICASAKLFNKLF